MSANDRQVGGDHYRKPIQPWDFIVSNGIGFLEGNVIKYVARWKEKGGVADLEKAAHYLQKLIETAKAETVEPCHMLDEVAAPPEVGMTLLVTCQSCFEIKQRRNMHTDITCKACQRRQVLAMRNVSGSGCCDRYCDNKACDCLPPE